METHASQNILLELTDAHVYFLLSLSYQLNSDILIYRSSLLNIEMH